MQSLWSFWAGNIEIVRLSVFAAPLLTQITDPTQNIFVYVCNYAGNLSLIYITIIKNSIIIRNRFKYTMNITIQNCYYIALY